MKQTAKYELFWSGFLKFADYIQHLSRSEKDTAIQEFCDTHTNYIEIGHHADGVAGIFFDRNLFLFLNRENKDADLFVKKISQSIERRLGPVRISYKKRKRA